MTHWQAVFADPQLPHALLATLVSTTIAAVGAWLIALLVIVALWPGPKWQRMCARLPWLLAIPHVAFATSALLLFADGGLSPALSLTHWQALFADPQLPHALLATLVSTTIAAVGALLIALLVIVALWPGPKWQRMCARLPWLLAIPHVAFATSALLLFADGGLLYDYFPYFTPPMDRFGIGLGLTLAVKESAFLLWILATDLASVWASPLQ